MYSLQYICYDILQPCYWGKPEPHTDELNSSSVIHIHVHAVVMGMSDSPFQSLPSHSTLGISDPSHSTLGFIDHSTSVQ